MVNQLTIIIGEMMEEKLRSAFQTVVRMQHCETQKKLVEFGLYYGQPPVLFCIQQHQKISQRDLTIKMGTSKEAMSTTLKRLFNNGFIQKSTDEVDRRIQLISLTKKGEEVARLCKENFVGVHEQMFSEFNENQKQECLELFELMLKGLGKEGQ